MSDNKLEEELELFKKEQLEKLIDAIKTQLPHINFERFHFEKMRWDGNAVCLPYTRKDSGEEQILDYYLPGQRPNSLKEVDKIDGVSGIFETRIPTGEVPSLSRGDGRYAILEDPKKDESKPGRGAPENKFRVSSLKKTIGWREGDAVHGGSSYKVSPGHEYYALLATCAALIIFDKEGSPLSFSHLNTGQFCWADLTKIKKYIKPGNQFLIIRGPEDTHNPGGGYFQEIYLSDLASYIEKQGVARKNIYLHASRRYEDDRLRGVIATLKKDGSVRVNYDDYDFNPLFSEKIECAVNQGRSANAAKTRQERQGDKTKITAQVEKLIKFIKGGFKNDKHGYRAHITSFYHQRDIGTLAAGGIGHWSRAGYTRRADKAFWEPLSAALADLLKDGDPVCLGEFFTRLKNVLRNAGLTIEKGGEYTDVAGVLNTIAYAEALALIDDENNRLRSYGIEAAVEFRSLLKEMVDQFFHSSDQYFGLADDGKLTSVGWDGAMMGFYIATTPLNHLSEKALGIILPKLDFIRRYSPEFVIAKGTGITSPYDVNKTPFAVFDRAIDFLKLNEDDSCVDLGCGMGRCLGYFGSRLQPNSWTVAPFHFWGYDISDVMVKTARNNGLRVWQKDLSDKITLDSLTQKLCRNSLECGSGWDGKHFQTRFNKAVAIDVIQDFDAAGRENFFDFLSNDAFFTGGRFFISLFAGKRDKGKMREEFLQLIQARSNLRVELTDTDDLRIYIGLQKIEDPGDPSRAFTEMPKPSEIDKRLVEIQDHHYQSCGLDKGQEHLFKDLLIDTKYDDMLREYKLAMAARDYIRSRDLYLSLLQYRLLARLHLSQQTKAERYKARIEEVLSGKGDLEDIDLAPALQNITAVMNVPARKLKTRFTFKNRLSRPVIFRVRKIDIESIMGYFCHMFLSAREHDLWKQGQLDKMARADIQPLNIDITLKPNGDKTQLDFSFANGEKIRIPGNMFEGNRFWGTDMAFSLSSLRAFDFGWVKKTLKQYGCSIGLGSEATDIDRLVPRAQKPIYDFIADVRTADVAEPGVKLRLCLPAPASPSPSPAPKSAAGIAGAGRGHRESPSRMAGADMQGDDIGGPLSTLPGMRPRLGDASARYHSDGEGAPQKRFARVWEITLEELWNYAADLHKLEEHMPQDARISVPSLLNNLGIYSKRAIIGAFDEQNNLVGYVMAMPIPEQTMWDPLVIDNDDGSFDKWLVSRMIILPEYRGSLVALQLFTKLCGVARPLGCRTFIAEIANKELAQSLLAAGATKFHEKYDILSRLSGWAQSFKGDHVPVLQFPVDMFAAASDAPQPADRGNSARVEDDNPIGNLGAKDPALGAPGINARGLRFADGSIPGELRGGKADERPYILSDRRTREDPGADYASANRMLGELIDIHSNMERVAKEANRIEDQEKKSALKAEWVAGLGQVEAAYRSIDLAIPAGRYYPYDYYKRELAKLDTELYALYRKINRAFDRNDRKALFGLNKELITANRRRLKYQLLAAILLAKGRSRLTEPKMIRNAVCKTLNGAIYSCQRLKEELAARSARLSVIGKKRRYLTVTEEGERVYVFKVADYDIEVRLLKERAEGQKEVYRKGVWIKSGSRLDAARKAVKAKRYDEARDIMFGLRDIYSGRAYQMQPMYRDVRDTIDGITGWIREVSLGQSPPAGLDGILQSFARLTELVADERHKVWQGIETSDVLASKIETIKKIPLQYVETCRIRSLIGYYIERITGAMRIGRKKLSERDRHMVLKGLGEIRSWLEAGIVDEKYFSAKDIAPATDLIEKNMESEAREHLIKIRKRLDKRAQDLDGQKRAIDEQILATARARPEIVVSANAGEGYDHPAVNSFVVEAYREGRFAYIHGSLPINPGFVKVEQEQELTQILDGAVNSIKYKALVGKAVRGVLNDYNRMPEVRRRMEIILRRIALIDGQEFGINMDLSGGDQYDHGGRWGIYLGLRMFLNIVGEGMITKLERGKLVVDKAHRDAALQAWIHHTALEVYVRDLIRAYVKNKDVIGAAAAETALVNGLKAAGVLTSVTMTDRNKNVYSCLDKVRTGRYDRYIAHSIVEYVSPASISKCPALRRLFENSGIPAHAREEVTPDIVVSAGEPSAETTAADLEREKQIAGDFWDELMMKVSALPKDEALIFGLEKGWIKNLGGVQEIINELELETRLVEKLKRIGFTNFIFRSGNGNELASILAKERSDRGAKFSNIIVLGGQSIVKEDNSNEFSKLKEKEDRALLIGVDPKELKDTSGTRLLEMCLLALKLSSGKLPAELNQEYIEIATIKNAEGKVSGFVFTPIKPYDISESARINRLQISEIDTKA